MKIELIRIRKNLRSIEGMLLLNGRKCCDTTESTACCLPEGLYPLRLHACPRAGDVAPLICADEPDGEESPAAPRTAPLLPVPAMCRRCKAAADARRVAVDNEIEELQYALANGMAGQQLLRYERQLAWRRRALLAEQRLPVCPRLCSGGGIYGGNGNADGGILLGTYQSPGTVTNSRSAYAHLLFSLRHAATQKPPFLLISRLRG